MGEKRMYHVKIKNEVKEYEAGITYHDIAKKNTRKIMSMRLFWYL